VLAWKKAQKLGRFDPHADEILSQKRDVEWKEVEERGMFCLISSLDITTYIT